MADDKDKAKEAPKAAKIKTIDHGLINPDAEGGEAVTVTSVKADPPAVHQETISYIPKPSNTPQAVDHSGDVAAAQAAELQKQHDVEEAVRKAGIEELPKLGGTVNFGVEEPEA